MGLRSLLHSGGRTLLVAAALAVGFVAPTTTRRPEGTTAPFGVAGCLAWSPPTHRPGSRPKNRLRKRTSISSAMELTAVSPSIAKAPVATPSSSAPVSSRQEPVEGQHAVWSRVVRATDPREGSGSYVAAAGSDSPAFVTSDEGRDIELPDFRFLFDRICQLSPLAKQVMERGSGASSAASPAQASGGGFDVIPSEAYRSTPDLPWKVVDSSKSLRIDKIDNFAVSERHSLEGSPSSSPPLLRFRSTLQGPCLGECFAGFIMDLNQRQKWDRQVDQVYEAHSVTLNIDLVREIQRQERRNQQLQGQENCRLLDWGTCVRIGVGYCRTKSGFVSPREQLTLCGIQEFDDGSWLIWGVEMDRNRHDPMLPPHRGGKRPTRAKSNLFCTTLTPRPTPAAATEGGQQGPLSFDVEYLLQLDIGGKIPGWVAGPVVTDNVRQMFSCARSFFAGTDPDKGLERYLLDKAREASNDRASPSSSFSPTAAHLRPLGACMEDRQALLMTF